MSVHPNPGTPRPNPRTNAIGKNIRKKGEFESSLLLHELDRRTSGVNHGLLHIHAKGLFYRRRLTAGILDSDSRQMRRVTLLDRRVNNSPRISSASRHGRRSRDRSSLGILSLLDMLGGLIFRHRRQSVQCVCQVLGVDFLVRSVFETRLPAMGRRRRRRNEEQLSR